jgi:hypothetical protein
MANVAKISRTLLRKLVGILATLLISAATVAPLTFDSSAGALLPADGPAPCSATAPSNGYRGYCGTYNSNNTWFGSYGLGFPTPLGWAFCAESPGSGSHYPDVGYNYQPSGAPSGANSAQFPSVGFAFSQATASGLWNGRLGAFTADQAAVGAKLFYDYLVYGGALPSMDPGVAAAFAQLSAWASAAQGAAAAPTLRLSLATPSTSSPLATTASAVVAFPGTNKPVAGVIVTLTASNGTFAGGSSSITVLSDSSGAVSAPVTASGLGTLQVTSSAPVGQLGLVFFAPTQFNLLAQKIVAGAATTTTSSSSSLEIETELFVAKSNAQEPDQGIPGAVYDLFVEGVPPASTPPTPPETEVPAGLTWYASGTTDESGHLGFTIPAGYSWCVKEVSAPPEYILDPALRCTAVITTSSTDPVRTLAVSEEVASVALDAFKFNALHPGLGIPGASYALFVVGPFPIGFEPPTPPESVSVPDGMEFFASGTTDERGSLRFTIPSGHEWCLREVVVPAGYLIDDGLHCTAVLTAESPESETTVALPEVAVLATTGSPSPFPLGIALILSGISLASIGRFRSKVRARDQR